MVTTMPPTLCFLSYGHGCQDTSVMRIAAQKATSNVTAEFDFSMVPEALQMLPTTYTSLPLSVSLLQSTGDIFSPNAGPTPIQALSLKHLFATPLGESY